MLMHRAFLHSVAECMWIPMYTSIGAGGEILEIIYLRRCFVQKLKK